MTVPIYPSRPSREVAVNAVSPWLRNPPYQLHPHLLSNQNVEEVHVTGRNSGPAPTLHSGDEPGGRRGTGTHKAPRKEGVVGSGIRRWSHKSGSLLRTAPLAPGAAPAPTWPLVYSIHPVDPIGANAVTLIPSATRTPSRRHG